MQLTSNLFLFSTQRWATKPASHYPFRLGYRRFRCLCCFGSLLLAREF